MSLLEQNIKSIPSPCYVMEEEALRKNLRLIQRVAERADVEIIWLSKLLLCGNRFLFFGNIFNIQRQVLLTKHDWHLKSLVVLLIRILLHTRKKLLLKYFDAVVISLSIPSVNMSVSIR